MGEGEWSGLITLLLPKKGKINQKKKRGREKQRENIFIYLFINPHLWESYCLRTPPRAINVFISIFYYKRARPSLPALTCVIPPPGPPPSTAVESHDSKFIQLKDNRMNNQTSSNGARIKDAIKQVWIWFLPLSLSLTSQSLIIIIIVGILVNPVGELHPPSHPIPPSDAMDALDTIIRANERQRMRMRFSSAGNVGPLFRTAVVIIVAILLILASPCSSSSSLPPSLSPLSPSHHLMAPAPTLWM